MKGEQKAELYCACLSELQLKQGLNSTLVAWKVFQIGVFNV